MTNKEVFDKYGKEYWIVEHQLVSLLQRYKEEGKNVNLVAFVKDFMEDETDCDTEIRILEKDRADFIDAEYTEGEVVPTTSSNEYSG